MSLQCPLLFNKHKCPYICFSVHFCLMNASVCMSISVVPFLISIRDGRKDRRKFDKSSLVILTLVQFYQLKSASSFAFRFFSFFFKCLIRLQDSLHFCQSSVRPKDLHQTGIAVTESFSLLFHANWSCRGGEGGGNCENTIKQLSTETCTVHLTHSANISFWAKTCSGWIRMFQLQTDIFSEGCSRLLNPIKNGFLYQQQNVCSSSE